MGLNGHLGKAHLPLFHDMQIHKGNSACLIGTDFVVDAEKKCKAQMLSPVICLKALCAEYTCLVGGPTYNSCCMYVSMEDVPQL